MRSNEEQLAAVMADVRSRLQEKLLWMIGDIEAFKKEMTDPDLRRPATQAIRDISHKISGIAGSVGFDELGQSAAIVDTRFSRLLAAPVLAHPDAAVLSELETLLDRMEDALDL